MTGFHAESVKDTLRRLIKQFGEGRDAFGIGTPGTMKGTTFQEDECTATGSVVNGEALYIEEDPVGQGCFSHVKSAQLAATRSG